MKNLVYLGILFMLSVVLNISCHKDQIEEYDLADATPIFTYTQTPCFGFCEAFEFKLYHNGLACFRDFNNPDQLTERSTVSSNCKAQNIEFWTSIKNMALEHRILSLSNIYPEDGPQIPDLSTRKIYIKIDGVEKTIVESYEAPANLAKFESAIHNMVMEFKTTIQSSKSLPAQQGIISNTF
ncbi:MAG: hypothetical protein ABIO44_01980 [Saprospiraceae bacterium]